MTTDVQQAVQRLHGLPDQIRRTNQEISGVNLGPFSINVSCRHGFLGWYSENYGFGVDFRSVREKLQNILQSAAVQGEAFDPVHQRLLMWFSSSLQVISDRMADLQAVSATAGRAYLTVRIADVIAILKAGREQLTAIDADFGNFFTRIDSYNKQLLDIQQNLDKDTQHDLDDASDFIESWSCGSGDGHDQLNGWKSTFTSSTGTIASSMKNLNDYTNSAKDGLAHILGLLTTSAAQFQPVLDQLAQADNAGVSRLVESLHLNVANELWSSLAAAAR